MTVPNPTREHREPLPAPFAAGTRLRYLGTAPSVGNIAKSDYYYLHPGDVVVVDHTTTGWRGGMAVDTLNDYSCGVEWIEKDTVDGVSVIAWDPVHGDYGHLVGGERVEVWKDVTTTDGKIIDRVKVWQIVGAKRIHTISERARHLWEVVS